MNTATHAPTPWAEQEMPGGCNDRITDTDGEGKTICEFPYGLDANSAHIVRCVNAHDDLVSALKFAKPIVGAAVAASPNETREQREKVYNKIVAALAKAGA